MQGGQSIWEPDLVWTGDRFESGVQVQIDEGRIKAVTRSGPSREGVTRLQGLALLPGFVNAHSHAFQRGLRGLGERFPEGSGSFWSWRQQMYKLVKTLDSERLYRLSLQCFREMLAAGITCVGEFHYVHHLSDSEAFDLDAVVLQAAADSGIRLVLLETYYRTGGLGRELEPGQRRFHTSSPEVYWRQMDALQSQLHPGQSLGAVVHSVRAGPIEEIAAIHREAQRRGLVFHIHAEEQRQEIEQCRAHYGCEPLTLLRDHLEIDERFTAVHCTHSTEANLTCLAERGASICVCPLTEANLGDGVFNLPAAKTARARICLGSDSNARISFLEEMRWLEYVQRLARECRGVWTDCEGNVGRRLLESATLAGSHSLGVSAGLTAQGEPADFVAIDLNAECLRDWSPDTLLETLVLGGGDQAIHSTYVGGRQVYLRSS